jgi:hypothetical protein
MTEEVLKMSNIQMPEYAPRGFFGVNVMLNVPCVYNYTQSLANNQITKMQWGYEIGKIITPYAMSSALGGPIGLLSTPSIMWYDKGINTFLQLYAELNVWGRNFPQRMSHYYYP